MERIQSMDFKAEAGRRLTESTHFVQVYPLSFKSDQDPEELVAVIKEMIVDDWNDNDADVRVVGQGLVLKQTWDNQLRVRDFLEGTGAIQRPSLFGWGNVGQTDGEGGGFGFGEAMTDSDDESPNPFDDADPEIDPFGQSSALPDKEADKSDKE